MSVPGDKKGTRALQGVGFEPSQNTNAQDSVKQRKRKQAFQAGSIV